MTEIDRLLVNGLWIPKGDAQLFDGLQADVKKHKRPMIDGRVAWRYDRIAAALEFLPANRRRVAIDVGAHIGLWTRWLARDFVCTHAFEPIKRHLACLRQNLFDDYGYVEIHNCALGDVQGSIAMCGTISTSGRSHVYDPCLTSKVTEEARCFPLDFYEYEDVDFIKIDVEGYETHVLEGARKTIKANHPVIVIEQLGHEERYGETRDGALALLKRWGMVELRENMKGDYYMGWPK